MNVRYFDTTEFVWTKKGKLRVDDKGIIKKIWKLGKVHHLKNSNAVKRVKTSCSKVSTITV